MRVLGPGGVLGNNQNLSSGKSPAPMFCFPVSENNPCTL